MVPSRVVRGGLLAASTGASSLPFGFKGLLLQVIVSMKKKQERYKISLVTTQKTSICQEDKVSHTFYWVCRTFIWAFTANSGDCFVRKASSLW